jgi:Dehydrogenases with different specificities (related to short-chain alcohol dehydrogenases)
MNEDKKVVLVTGAASGIGASIAKHFLDLGYGVHVCDQNTTS